MVIPIFASGKAVPVFATLGVIAMLIGGGLLLFNLLNKKHTVHLFEGGLVRDVAGKTKWPMLNTSS